MVKELYCKSLHVIIKELEGYVQQNGMNQISPKIKLLYNSVSFKHYDVSGMVWIPTVFNWKFSTQYYPFHFWIEIL